ncbi:HAMP domain-containing histidine kinase [Candidatus Saccharibacteria bacterium]|nr:HAMP domain-containing histidine kinase [Candidatus Saccharibacteria bacterium]
MFRKLRNRLIIINLSITTIVILVAFTAIYLFVTQSAQNRPPTPENQTIVFTEDFENYVNVTIRNEKQAAANNLLITLVVSGVAIELIVAVAAYYLAEEAIKPVREAYEAQKVFIANASHEIKTPLAAISANLEAADIHGNKWISNVEKETEKLTELNKELLALARTDLMEKSALDEVDLKKVTVEYLKTFEPRLAGKDFKSIFATHGRMRLVRQDYEQVLGILIDNALKYSEKKIMLRLNNDELVVENDGAVISEKDLPHVFERFYQADKSAEGVGLGLAIAKSIAIRNGWELSAESEAGATRFVMKF